jgi:hypothetical protein
MFKSCGVGVGTVIYSKDWLGDLDSNLAEGKPSRVENQ